MNDSEGVPGADAFGRLTREAAAKLLGFAPGTLAHWATTDYGPRAYKSGKNKVYYLASEVRDFALSGARSAAQ